MVYLTRFFYICYLALNVVYGEPISNFTKPDPLPKYFGIDIDGTFYIDDEDLMNKNVEAFKLLQSKNIHPFFCTGRQRNCVKTLLGDKFFDETGYSGYPGIYSNGSIVYDSEGKIIHLDKLSTDFLDKFKNYLEQNNLMADANFHTQEGVFCITDLSDKMKKFLVKMKINELNQTTFEELKEKSVTSVVWFCEELNDAELKKEVYFVVDQSNGTCQVSPSTTNKKLALEKLLQSFKSNGNECAYIGDGDNDAECLDYCSTSFAVGNAFEKAKEKAKWVMDLNFDQGAFAKAVEILCK